MPSRTRSLILVAAIAIVFGGSAHAATRTWDGEDGDENWSTAANWSDDTAPGSGDVATFDSTSTKDCIIDANVSVAGIDINSGYTGTITQGTGNTVTVGASNFDQAAGTFTGGDSAIDVNGSFTQSAGTFTATSSTLNISGGFTVSGGTFSHNSGEVVLDGGAKTVSIGSTIINDLTLSMGSAILTVTGAIDVNGDLIITNVNQINTGTIKVAGNATVTDAYIVGTGAIEFDGSGAQALGASGGTTDIVNMVVNKSAGTLTISDTITVQDTFTLTAGTVNAGSATITLDGAYSQAAGSITAPSGTLEVKGDFTISGGTFTHNSGTVKLVATGTISIGSAVLNDLTLATSSSTLTVTGTVDLDGDLTLSNINNINTGTIKVAGDVTTTDDYVRGTGVIEFDGTGAQSLGAGGDAGEVIEVVVNKSGGTDLPPVFGPPLMLDCPVQPAVRGGAKRS